MFFKIIINTKVSVRNLEFSCLKSPFIQESIVGGGSDGLIHLWESVIKSSENGHKLNGNGIEQSPGKSSEFIDMDNIEDVLRVLISHKSISGNPGFRRDCCKVCEKNMMTMTMMMKQ